MLELKLDMERSADGVFVEDVPALLSLLPWKRWRLPCRWRERLAHSFLSISLKAAHGGVCVNLGGSISVDIGVSIVVSIFIYASIVVTFAVNINTVIMLFV